jgi:hypothetical protein
MGGVSQRTITLARTSNGAEYDQRRGMTASDREKAALN